MAFLTRSLAALALATSFVISAQAQSSSNGLVLKSVSRPQQTRLVPGGTVVLQALLENRGETLAEGKMVAVVAGVTSETSARVVQLAPKTSEGIELYVQIPANLEDTSKVEIDCTLYVKDGNQEVIQSQNGRPAQYTIPLSMERMPSLAAVVMDPEPDQVPYWYWPKPGPSESYELAVATRIDTGNTRQTANYDARALPVSAIDWSVADVIMIGEKRALDDAAFVESLKRFVAQGGRVWIMLDRVDSEAVRPLLGTGQMCETVDQIEVNKFVITRSNSSTTFVEADRTVESVDPFVFKRVIFSGGRVSHSIGEWPAAIWMPVGYGEVLLTTLECGAWMKKRADPSPYLLYQAEFESHDWAKDLASEVNDLRRNIPLTETVDYPLQLIGNPIVPRGWVASALAGFCVVLALLGAWRTWAGELSVLGLLAPVAALLFGSVLVVASTYVRRDSPESDSRLQIIQVTDDGTAAIVREQGAVHLESQVNMALSSDVDGTASIAESMISGIKRYVVTDLQQWKVENDGWQSGTWRFDTSYTLPVADKYVAAELDSSGVSLALPDLPSPLEDPVLSYGLGHPMLCTNKGEQLFADGSLQADGGRWISGTIISDEQQRRMDVYQKFFSGGERVSQLSRVLYGWTTPWTGGPKWSKELEAKGAALVALPVRIQRPPEGKEVFVPHGLIPIRRNPAAKGQTFAFDPSTGTWQKDGLTNMLQAEMQFVIPPELAPFKASSIEIEFDITAPSRTVRLVGASTTGAPIEIVKLESPSIPWNGTITDPELLKGVTDGFLDVRVEVSERQDSGSNVLEWNIQRLQASVRGAVGQSSSIGTSN